MQYIPATGINPSTTIFTKEMKMAGKRLTKTEFVNAIADKSNTNKRQVAAMLEAMNSVITEQLNDGNDVTIPGLLKLSVTKKEAQPEREGINPFTKEPTIFKAKPERKVVKARPMKALKDAV
jgi:DNA-binding protein HU-beta